jgi:lambda family phage tail tape measure protein
MIDWKGVQDGTKTVSEANKEAAEKIERIAALQDMMKIGMEQLKVGILDFLTPLVSLVEGFKKFEMIGKVIKLLIVALKVAFATLLIVINDILSIVEIAASAFGAVFDAVALAAQGKFAEAGKALMDFGAKFKQVVTDADKYANSTMLDALGMGEKKEPKAKDDKPKTSRDVVAANKGQVDSIQGLSDAFADSNARALEKIKSDYAMIGSSKEVSRVLDEQTRIANAAEDQIKKLQDQKSKLGAGATDEGTAGAIEKSIRQIRTQAILDKAAVKAAIEGGELRVRSLEDVKAAMEITFGGESERRQIEQSIKLAASETEVQRRLLEEKFKLEETYLKELADLKAKYVGNKDGVPQAEMDQLAFRKKASEQQRALTDADIAANITNQQQFSTGWTNAFNQFQRDSEDNSRAGASAFNTFRSGFESTLTDFVMTGKLSFKEFARSMLAEFVKIQAASVFKALFAAGGPLGTLGTMFGLPGKAEGGPVTGGMPYMVGERGKELFIPKTAGTIIPNNQLGSIGGGGGSTLVTYNITATDAQSFRSMLARDPEYLYGLTENVRRSQPSRRRQ